MKIIIEIEIEIEQSKDKTELYNILSKQINQINSEQLNLKRFEINIIE